MSQRTVNPIKAEGGAERMGRSGQNGTEQKFKGPNPDVKLESIMNYIEFI